MIDGNLTLVDSLSDAEEFLRWLGERRPHLAIDTETAGLKWWEPNFLRMVQFGDARSGYAIPVEMWKGVAHQALSSYTGESYFLNAKFDLHALESAGLPLPPVSKVHDIGTMHRLIDPTGHHSLKGLGARYIGPEATYGEELLKAEFARTGTSWATIPYDNPVYWAYGVMDTIITSRLVDIFQPLTPAVPYEREMAVQMVMYRAESRGLRIDPVYTSGLRDQWREEAAALRATLVEAGIENPNSNVQVAQVLKEAGWEPTEYTETGQARLDKEVLAAISATYPDVAEPLLRYKRLVKWGSSYLDRMLTDRDDNDRVHPSIHTQAARTGRMSVTSPAFQTLPRGPEIRDCVIPDDGKSLWSIDYQGMELVMFTEYSGDPAMSQAIHDGEDLHSFSASLVYGVPLGEVTPEQRGISKNTSFCRLYGGGPAKIASTAGVSEAEVRDYVSALDARFPETARFIKTVQHEGKMRLAQEGEAYITTLGGRRVPADDDKTYALMNYLIQGSCADLFKDAILRLEYAGFGDNILMPVHDELIFEFDEGDEESPRDALALMEVHDLSVPFRCDAAGPLSRWGDAYR